MNWLESASMPEEGVMSRYVALDLTGLPAGDYDLVVDVERSNGDRARASRRMHVAPLER